MWVIPKKEEPETARKLRKKILIIFIIKKDEEAKRTMYILVFAFIFPVVKLRISRR